MKQLIEQIKNSVTEALPQDSTSKQDEPDRVWIIIEDEPSLRLVLSSLVKMWGRQPLEFEDGHQAMKWVEDFKAGRYKGAIPELTLSDIEVPGPQGHEVCRELRMIPALSNMPIIMHSAWDYTPEERKQVMQISQADRLLTVPLPKVNEFKAIIDEVIEAKERMTRTQ